MTYVDQHYKDTSGGIHFLSAQDQSNAAAQGFPLPDPTWTEIDADTAAAAVAPTSAWVWATYQATARIALADSDATILRCYENAVVVPEAWAAYRKALRAIISASTGDATHALPTKPAYPSGT